MRPTRTGTPRCGTRGAASAPTTSARTRRGRRRAGRSTCSAACGSGRAPSSPATPGSRASPTASTPRSSSATATRCCAAVRGPRTRARSAPRSGTGTSRSAVRSSAASVAPGTPDVCRHLAYLGPPRAVRDLLFDAPHALVHQGRAPRERVVAKDNPDGWGVAWWEPGSAEPRRYRTTTVMWEDTGFAAGDEKAVAVLAAVRKASPNTTLRSENNAPFLAPSRVGPLAFSLNGHAFHASCEARVRGALTPGTPLAGDTDSEVLFALVRERIEAGRTPADAVA